MLATNHRTRVGVLLRWAETSDVNKVTQPPTPLDCPVLARLRQAINPNPPYESEDINGVFCQPGNFQEDAYILAVSTLFSEFGTGNMGVQRRSASRFVRTLVRGTICRILRPTVLAGRRV